MYQLAGRKEAGRPKNEPAPRRVRNGPHKQPSSPEHRTGLSRSKNNAHSKGYAYIEFELREVAEVLAEFLFFICTRIDASKNSENGKRIRKKGN